MARKKMKNEIKEIAEEIFLEEAVVLWKCPKHGWVTAKVSGYPMDEVVYCPTQGCTYFRVVDSSELAMQYVKFPKAISDLQVAVSKEVSLILLRIIGHEI